MTRSYLLIFLTIITTASMSCDTNGVAMAQEKTTEKVKHKKDTILLKPSFKEDDIENNEYLTETLQPIKDNFKRINSKTDWKHIDSTDVMESTEGGIIKYYYGDKSLEKVIEQHFGEMGQSITEYYLLNGKLSFVLERAIIYNRPLYYDSTAMKENKDTEVFNKEASELLDTRSYFIDGVLSHILDNQDCGAPFAASFMIEEDKRLHAAYKRLIALHKKK